MQTNLGHNEGMRARVDTLWDIHIQKNTFQVEECPRLPRNEEQRNQCTKNTSLNSNQSKRQSNKMASPTLNNRTAGEHIT